MWRLLITKYIKETLLSWWLMIIIIKMKNVDYSIIIDKHILLHTRKKDGPDIRYAAGYSNRHPFSDRITDSLSALAYQHGWISGQSTFGRYIRYVLGLRRLNAFHSSNFTIIPGKLFFKYLFLNTDTKVFWHFFWILCKYRS